MRTYIHNGERVNAPFQLGARSKIVTWLDGGPNLEKEGNYSEWKAPDWNGAVLHFGGSTPQKTVDILNNRGLSTTFIVDGDTIYQVADLGHKTWHAGGGNHMIGIDIAEYYKAKHLDRARKEDPGVRVIKNTTGRGDEEALSLDPTTKRTVRELLKDLTGMFGFAYDVPRNPDGSFRYDVLPKEESKRAGKVFAHFHLSEDKWDPASWWEDLFSDIRHPWQKKAAAILAGGLLTFALYRWMKR